MPATLTGKATVEGISGTVTYPAIVANGALEALQASVTDQADVQVRNDAVNDPKGYRVRNKRKEISVTCLMTVSSGTAIADAKKALIFPPIPGVVTLASFDEATGAGINGAYLYLGGGTVSYGDDWGKMVLPLVKPDGTAAATLAAAVT